MNITIIFVALALMLIISVAAVVVAWQGRQRVAKLQRIHENDVKHLHELTEQLATQVAEQVNDHAQRLKSLESRKASTPPPKPERKPDKASTPTTFFMAKPDDTGHFARVTEQFELGNSIYQLTVTSAGRGTFAVVDRPEVHQFAMMMPTENLMLACRGEGIQRASGKQRIVTDQPGEAVCENGVWRVIAPAVIHYE